MLWERTVKHEYTFSNRVVMTADTFERLPTISDTPDSAFQYPAYRPLKALIAVGDRKRWHLVERGGYPVEKVYAREIVIRVYAKE